MRSPLRTTVAGIALLVSSLAACASVPTSGPIGDAGEDAAGSARAPFDFNPPGPRRGATPDEVVGGFLTALQATPVSTRVASEYLTSPAAESWVPQRRTLVYTDQETRPGRTDAGPQAVVEVGFGQVYALDGAGRWQGEATRQQRRLRLTLVREDGEWRVSDPPDAMVVPLAHFENRYERHSLYFFEPTGRLLVPEPVYIPRGAQAASQLVSDLLDGPRGTEAGVERTFIPATTRLAVSVPISDDGTAEVPLTGELALEPADLDRAMAQFVWTLRQLPEVRAVTVTVDGNAVPLPGGVQAIEVAGMADYSPYVPSAARDLYAVRGRRVVEVGGERAALAPRRLGRIRGLGVSIAGDRFAVADDEGVSVLAPAAEGRSPVLSRHPVPVADRPMWDWSDHLWLVTRQGVDVSAEGTGRLRPLVLRGLAGRQVQAAALSRDGSRLAVALAGTEAGVGSLAVARVVRDGAREGAPVRLTRLRPVPSPAGGPGALGGPVRSLGWRDPITLAALTRGSSTTSRVALASVDGEGLSGTLVDPVDTLFARGLSLAASPGRPQALVVAASDGSLHTLDAQGRWSREDEPLPLRRPAFVG